MCAGLRMQNLRSLRKIRSLEGDRKSTRLNSSHDQISYAVFCLKKKKTNKNRYASNPSTIRAAGAADIAIGSTQAPYARTRANSASATAGAAAGSAEGRSDTKAR